MEIQFQKEEAGFFQIPQYLYLGTKLVNIKIINNKCGFDNALIEIISSTKPFDMMVADLVPYLQGSTEEQAKKFETVLQYLSSVLNTHFPCKIFNFGSSATGLFLKTSDIDMHVDLIPPVTDSEECMTHLKQCIEILMENDEFDNVLGVLKAKIPLIKCEHRPTGLNCDIKFKGSFEVSNTALLIHFQSLDERIKPLLLLIKNWAAKLNFLRRHALSSYALAMMTVFFLQQKHMLPSVYYLQSSTSDHGEWNTEFQKDVEFEIENKQTLFNLLGDFFEFYKNFDFQEVISPLTGTSHNRQDFAKSENIPFEYERYKLKLEHDEDFRSLYVKSSIVIIDPFELSKNITSTSNYKFLKLFKEACIVSAKCFKTDDEC